MAKGLNVAVLLAGCGHMDGAEISESVLTLLALDQHGAKVQCFALDRDQHHVVNHLTGQAVEGQHRNILEEAARIARGKILPLSEADPKLFDALIMPGGFGVAKNHCGFAFNGIGAEVQPEVLKLVTAFFQAKKPIGAICIAPALVALILKNSGQSAALTIGNDKSTTAALRALGANPQERETAREVVVDEALNLVTTPAYMFGDARLSDVFVGIERAVAEVLKRA
jgi:enhancing lycopene biosynthesis protein 2